MEDQEFSFESTYKQIPSDAQTVKAYGAGLMAMGKLAVMIVLLTAAAASCWPKCLLRWRPGLTIVLTRYITSLICLNLIAQFYATSPWFDVFKYTQVALFFAILLHLGMGLARLYGAPGVPVHSASPGEPHPLIGWFWRAALWWDDDPDLTINLIGEPLLVMLLAAGVYAIELTVLPAPDTLWPVSTWLLIVVVSMMGENAVASLSARWSTMRMMDHEIEQQKQAEEFMEQRAALQERQVEGVAQVPLVELPEPVGAMPTEDAEQAIETVGTSETGR